MKSSNISVQGAWRIKPRQAPDLRRWASCMKSLAIPSIVFAFSASAYASCGTGEEWNAAKYLRVSMSGGGEPNEVTVEAAYYENGGTYLRESALELTAEVYGLSGRYVFHHLSDLSVDQATASNPRRAFELPLKILGGVGITGLCDVQGDREIGGATMVELVPNDFVKTEVHGKLMRSSDSDVSFNIRWIFHGPHGERTPPMAAVGTVKFVSPRFPEEANIMNWEYLLANDPWRIHGRKNTIMPSLHEFVGAR